MTDDFRRLMLAEMPRLRASALGLTGSPQEAEDLVQEALLRAWRFRERFVEGTNFSGWIFRILKNIFLTQKSRSRAWVEDVDGQFSDRQPSPPDQEWRLRCAEVLDRLPHLPNANRDALLLVVASGLSYQEAAEAAGCDVAVLRGRVHRARVQLADLTDAPATPRDRAAFL